MGRNPVVGRQGPVYHAADIPSEQAAGTIAVKQIRSEIGHPETMRRTLRALGLREPGAVRGFVEGPFEPTGNLVPQTLGGQLNWAIHAAVPLLSGSGKRRAYQRV